jgi:RimJ/RimL family protein N-acetyltransferase
VSDAVLRAWRDEDAPRILQASVEPDLVHQIVLPEPGGLDGAATWVAGRIGFDPNRTRSFAIEHDGHLAGEVALHSIDARHRVATVGYWLMPEARRRGIATRATSTLVSWAFDELDIERVGLDHRVNNPTSGAVAERCGFSFEGIQRDRLRYDGVRYDVATYGILHTDPRPAIAPLVLRG